MYDKLVTKVNFIDNKIPSTGRLVSKTQYDSEKKYLEEEIPNTSVFVKSN